MRMRIRLLVMLCLCLSLLLGCSPKKSNDFTTWDEEKVFSFLNEIRSHISEIPIETNNKAKIVKLYEQYFSPELSVKIADSLYVKSGNDWKIPDGDSGYLFIVPNKEQNEVKITFTKDSIIVEEIYEPETWMYAKIQYTITYEKKPVITEWIIQ